MKTKGLGEPQNSPRLRSSQKAKLKGIFLRKYHKIIPKGIDKQNFLCYNLGVARGCAQAFGTLNEFTELDSSRGRGSVTELMLQEAPQWRTIRKLQKSGGS